MSITIANHTSKTYHVIGISKEGGVVCSKSRLTCKQNVWPNLDSQSQMTLRKEQGICDGMTLFVLPEHSPMDESSYELMIRVDPSVHQHVAIGKPVKHTAIQRWIITGVISIGILVAFVIAHIVLLTLKA